jgi:hypothetical protein
MDLRLIHDATFNGIIFVEVITWMRIIFLFFYLKKILYYNKLKKVMFRGGAIIICYGS